MKQMRVVGIGLLIIGPALLRTAQFEWNLVPMGALALFAGAHFRSRIAGFGIPLVGMILADVMLGVLHRNMEFYTFHPMLPIVYGCYAASVLMGIGLQKHWDGIDVRRAGDRDRPEEAYGSARGPRGALGTRVLPIATATLGGALLFFLVTNFGDWYIFDTYARSWKGLGDCYLAGLPFFRGTLIADVAGSALLFGGESLLRTHVEAAAEPGRF